MSNWKSIGRGLLSVIAVSIVAGSTLDDPQEQPRSTDQVIFAVVTFLSVIILHWLLWRFIIPSSSVPPAQSTAFFRSQTPRGFFRGTVGFGYMAVAHYCVQLSGYLKPHDSHLRVGYLVMG